MHSRGFTLLEMMIVCILIAVLSSIAYPKYLSYIQKTRRAEGKAALLAAAVQMERYMTERGTYATASLGPSGVYPNHTDNNIYSLALSNQTTSSYTLKATPLGSQVDDPCGSLTYTDAGVKGVTGTTAVSMCW